MGKNSAGVVIIGYLNQPSTGSQDALMDYTAIAETVSGLTALSYRKAGVVTILREW